MAAGPLNWFSQVVSVTGFGLRTLPERKGSSAAAVFGIAGVVAVMVGVLSIANGIIQTMKNSAAPENAIVLRSGSDTEMMSGLSGDNAKLVAEAPGIARYTDGPIASSELFVIINLPKRSTGTDANVPLRGVVPAAFEVRDRFRLTEGRRFEWGLNEVVVGAGAAREFAGLELGGSLEVGSERWPIVGIFEAGGGIAESEIWCDAAVLQPAYRRGNSYQSVYAKLTARGAFPEFKDSLTTDPRLNVKVLHEDEYYSSQSAMLTNLITGLGTIVALIMGLGAFFGALNTMYTAVSARTREIATLRALGFSGGPVVISVLLESLVLALVGGAIGGGLAWIAFDGFRAATINWSSFSQVTFAFDVTPSLLVQGIVYALLIGLVGGLFPAIRAARLPVATALREL
ncbi:MAG: FtsX-like permease family protein [Acidobacteria bacterium]|nr:MAG: FtsX-like permease family protein [Acidobacteriota bacterium]